VRIALVALAACLAGCGTLTVEKEKDLGDKFEREVRREYRFVRDPIVNDYVTKIGEAILAPMGPQPFSYTFQVVEDDEVNAFAGPAGQIYIHTGTILRARNVTELAGVIAHEIGHVANRHVAENYEKQRAASIGRQAAVIGAGVLGGGLAAGATNLATGVGAAAVLNSFSREAEEEADAFAVGALVAADYDPNGLPSFFETLASESKSGTPSFLASHPAPVDRLEKTRALIGETDLSPGLATEDGGRFEIIQQRVELLTHGGSRKRSSGGRGTR
jgi:predicted Zn-dependent protease